MPAPGADAVHTTWMLFPRWLHEEWGGSAAVLEQVLRGQFALFSFIRIQDDLLDGHHQDLEAQFVADGLLVDSLEAYQELPGLGSGFWQDFRRRLRDTVTGILEVRALERAPGAFRAEHLVLHAQVSAIFGVGVTAVCHLCGRDPERAWLDAVQRHISVCGQVCDDLEDLEADLATGRHTWVANVLGGEAHGAGLMDPGRTDVIIARLREHAAAAEAALPAHAPARIREYVAATAAQAEALQAMLHECRVRAVFGAAARIPA